MMTSRPSSGPRDSLLATALAFFLAAVVLAIFVQCPGLDQAPGIRFHQMIYGEADKPFVARALLPITVRSVATVLPEGVHDACSEFAETQPTLSWIFTELEWGPEYALEFLLALVCLAVALVGFRYALFHLINAVYVVSPRFAAYAASVALVFLPVFFRYYSHIYDFPNLALFTLGLVAMVRRRWSVYFIALFLAAVNKETSILLILIFAVYYRLRPLSPRRHYLLLLGAQLGLYVLIRGALSLHFAGNPGTFLEFHLLDHNLQILLPFSIADAAAWLFVGLLLGIQWNKKPLLPRVGLLVLVVLCAMAVFFGYFDELRMYYEVFPSVCLLLCHSFAVVWQVPIEVRRGPGGAPV